MKGPVKLFTRISPFGDRAILIEFGGEIHPQILERVRETARDVEKNKIPGIRELIPSYCSLLIGYDPSILSFWQLSSWLQRFMAIENRNPSQMFPVKKVPVVYGGHCGPDLNFVAEFHDLPPDEVIRWHSSATYLVYAIGGFPGLPAMGTLPRKIETPRLSTPRKKVAAGSVAIAGRQTGIYAIESPGGWQLIGRTPLKIFDPNRNPPSLFQIGDRVRFFPVSGTNYSWESSLDAFGPI